MRRIALVPVILMLACAPREPEVQAAAAAPAPPPPRRPPSAAEVKATGVIKPMIGAEVRVGSRVSGVVRRLYVRVGDVVKAGAALAELDDRDFAARRNEARAALQLARANADYARAELHRKEELHALIAASELDVARRASAVAAQQVAQAKASLDFAAAQLDYTKIVAPPIGATILV